MQLNGKVVIITGGGRGIAFGLSTAFAKAGAKIVITGRTESTLLAAKEKLESAHGCEVLTVTADGADEQAIQNVIDKTVEKFGRIDAVVNNAQASASGKMLIPGLIDIHTHGALGMDSIDEDIDFLKWKNYLFFHLPVKFY